MRKKNFKKIFLSILMFLGLSFSINILNVNASTAPKTVKTKSKSNIYYYSGSKGTDYISGYNFYRKELSDGTLAYCISNINTKVPAGMTLTSKGAIDDAGLDYIIKNGYPNKSFTGDGKKDYYITQSAIWKYFDETKGSKNWKNTTFNSSSTGMKKYVYDLVQKAKTIDNIDFPKPSISLGSLNDEMNLKDNYYVSDPIKVTLINSVGTYTVSLTNAPSGTIIKNKNGEQKNTFNNNEEFVVYVPASSKDEKGSVKVNIATQGVTYRVYRYTTDKKGYQDIAPTKIYEEYTDKVNKEVTFTYENIVTKVKISKQDIASKKELPGATLVIKDKNGKIVDTWVSSNEPHYIEGLAVGTYTLSETIAPNGYVLSTETIEFTVKADGTVTNVTMYNAKKEGTKVKISKQDITSKKELPGATLVIKDKNGKIIDTWVSSNEPHYIEGLAVGTYTLSETIAPNGYVLSTETIEFTVKDDGKVVNVVMYNHPYTDVPITDLNINQTIMVIASFVMALGLGIVVYYAKFSK